MAAPFASISVVGLGLIGGSICRAVRQRWSEVRIVGIDRASVTQDQRTQELINHLLIDAPLIDELLTDTDRQAVARAVAAADLCVLATPVSAIRDSLPVFLDHARVLTDCGSTKRTLARAAAGHPRAGRFVPGHPMAGKPQGGLAEASATLFEARAWILCPEASDADAASRVQEFVAGIGAVPVVLNAEQHDAAVAVTSHLPQLLASALLVLGNAENATQAAGPSYLRATRVAGGSAAIWRDIFESNADQVARVSRLLARTLTEVAEDLDKGDAQSALHLLEAARKIR